MKNTLLPVALAAGALFVLPAIGHAQATDGAFINGNLGSASLESGSIDDNDISYGVNVGYRWAVPPGTLIGFEVGYVDLGKYSLPTSVIYLTFPGTQPNVPTTIVSSGTTEMSGLTIGAYGRFNLSPNWYIGGRAGFLRASVDSRLRTAGPYDSVVLQNRHVNADGWYVGAGFGYNFSNKFSLGLNYDYYIAKKSGSTISPDVVSVSGEYRF